MESERGAMPRSAFLFMRIQNANNKNMNPFIFNLFNGIILTLVGLWSYSLEWNYALYFIGLGILLIFLTYFVRKSDKTLGSIAMLSTLLSTVVLGVLFYLNKSAGNAALTPIAMMATSGFVTSLAFVQCAMNHNEEEACCAQPADGSECCDKSLSQEENAKATGCC